jgi:hypothetical protein
MAFVNFDFVRQSHRWGDAIHGRLGTRLKVKAKLIRDQLVVF